MSESAKAVFLSYASQDVEAARRIWDTLRSGGVEVWFDADGGLEHGDEWDAKIRRQIKECVLFIPVISANTQAREEGYFRLEWDLAAERARTIASGVPFILPVVIDDTREPDALVPDRFRAVQWTKLLGGEVPPEVQQRLLKLWSHRTGVLKNEAARSGNTSPGFSSRPGFQSGRGLAAVVFTDVVGYSSRMQRDEAGTMALVAADFELMGARCAEHGGEVLNTMGDGLLMCFSSAVQAVACALQIQSEFGRRRGTMPPEQALEHRMGVHIGDVFRQDTGGVAGDGVNIAARLEGKAPVGGVCISQMVHDTVKGKVPMQAVFIGPESFKNITEPISVWHIAPEGSSTLSRPPMVGRAKVGAKKHHRWKMAAIVACALAVLGAGGYFGFRSSYDRQVATARADLGLGNAPMKKESRVLVARLENRSGDSALEMVGQLVADRVRRRVTLLGWVNDAVALPASARPDPEATPEQLRALAKKTGADALLTGYYYKQGAKVVLTGRVVDLSLAKTLTELAPIEGSVSDPSDAIAETAERMLGAANSVDDARHGREDVASTVNLSVPSRFDALEIRRQESTNSDDLDRYRRSYELDRKGSLQALINLALVHFYRGQFVEADKVLQEVGSADTQYLSPYSRATAKWMRESIRGNRDEALAAMELLHKWRPNLSLWKTQRVYGLLRAMKPRAVLAEFASIPPGSPAEKLVVVWVARIAANFLLHDYPAMLAAADRLRALEGENDYTLWARLHVEATQGHYEAVTKLLDAYDTVKPSENFNFNLYVVALAILREAGKADSPEFAAILKRANHWFETRSPKVAALKETRFAKAEMLYLAGRYAETRKMAEEVERELPNDLRVRSLIATCAARLGDAKTAHEVTEWLRSLDPKFRFGYHLFAQAKIAAVLGQRDDALRLLREAFAQHVREIEDFSRGVLVYSPDFDSLRRDPAFKELITPQG